MNAQTESFSWHNRRVFLTGHTGFKGGWLALWLLPTFLVAQHPQETAHVRGPNGLEGWKLTSVVETLENQGPLPTELILARNGRIFRRVKGDFFIWNWMFLPDGRRVAYETGPLHFAMNCVLIDITTGRKISQFDCYDTSKSSNAPAWVKTLESHPSNTP